MPLSARHRQLRLLVLNALESQIKQFRGNQDLWPFRVPHAPLDLESVIEEALKDVRGALGVEELRSRAVVSMEWGEGSTWEAWAIALPSGLHVYCDTDGTESRVLASAKRGSALEADRFFLELLAESHGAAVGIEMGGAAPTAVRTPIEDRAFLAEVCVEFFEGTPAERDIRAAVHDSTRADFREDVERWLQRVLTAPPERGGRRFRRFRELDDPR